MTNEQLQAFCGDDYGRPLLLSPFNQDGFTTATNGRILIRVPERPEFAQQDHPKIQQQFDRLSHTKMIPWHSELLPKGWKECPACLGWGKMTDCEACDGFGVDDEWGDDCHECNGEGEVPAEFGEIPCGVCDGSGKVPEHDAVRLGSRLFYTSLLSRVLELPSLRIAIDGDPSSACYFTFEGGEGLVMPRKPHSLLAESTYEIMIAESEAEHG